MTKEEAFATLPQLNARVSNHDLALISGIWEQIEAAHFIDGAWKNVELSERVYCVGDEILGYLHHQNDPAKCRIEVIRREPLEVWLYREISPEDAEPLQRRAKYRRL